MRRLHPVLRTVAALLVVCLLGSCTANEPRAPIVAKNVSIDWSRLPAQTLKIGDLTLQGIVLTPSQWPLEESVHRFFSGDISGMISTFDLTFRPSTIPDGVLSDLFSAGYIPAYVRIANGTALAQTFDPQRLVVAAEPGLLMPSVDPSVLPERFLHFSATRTGEAAKVVLIYVVVILIIVALLSNKGNGSVNLNLNGMPDPKFPPYTETVPAAATPDDGLLRSETFAPGEGAEGLLFFHVPDGHVDWSTAKLAGN